MILHLTRGLAAVLNFLVGGVLTAWFIASLYLWHRNPFDAIPNVGDFLLLISVVLLTIAGTGTGILLTRRRTTSAGIKWHFAAGLSWPLMLCGYLLLSLTYSRHLYSTDWSIINFLSGLTAFWFFLGVALNKLFHLDMLKQSAPLANHQQQPTTLDPQALTAPVLTRTTSPSQETTTTATLMQRR